MTVSPVLFMVFSRPDTTARVFETIRQARPKRLYVAADGAREGRPQEKALCEETRRVATQVDWPCEVKTLFREQNLGCKVACSSAVDWFFENEPEGIILEDDCMPHADFFPYCDDLLARYRNDSRVMCISGSCFLPDLAGGTQSYYFSRYPWLWGWASWRRAWATYDVTMAEYLGSDRDAFLRRVLPPGLPRRIAWRRTMDRTAENKLDTWCSQWVYACLANTGLCTFPESNLVANIGFDERATHTTRKDETVAQRKAVGLAFPLVHPSVIAADTGMDARIEAAALGIKQTLDLDGLRRFAKIKLQDMLRGNRRHSA